MSDMGNVHSNDVEAELDGVMRTLIAAAGRMGENLARMREEAARRAEAQSTQRARETQLQFEQERAMARAQVQPTQEPAWWDRARPEDVAHAYETSAAWKDTDPDLAQAHAHMVDELRERYGIDVNDVQADPQRVAEVLRQRTAGMDVPEQASTAEQAGSTEQERREADQLLNAADQHDRNAEAARGDATAAQNGVEGDRAPGVGPNGEVGEGYEEDPETPRLDPNAGRTITLSLNAYEAQRLDDLLNGSDRRRVMPWEEEPGFDEKPEDYDYDMDREEDARVSTMQGIRGRLSEGREQAANTTASSEQSAGNADRSAGLSAWDNVDRRDAHAGKMAEQGVEPTAVQAQYGADVSNAKHPRAAVAYTRGAAKARKTATKAMGATRERGERGR